MSERFEGAFVYMLLCADGAYYVGSYRGADLNVRVAEHNSGFRKTAWTYRRRPVELVWAEHFARYDEAVACERQIKGWSRAKKAALIERDYVTISKLARSKQNKRGPSS
ncbi:MAG: GIY-YIG nuclease family protein [Henriciella sp.]